MRAVVLSPLPRAVRPALAVVLAASLPGCMPPLEIVEEPIRRDNRYNLEAKDLELTPQQTTLVEAERAMRDRGLTGVTWTRSYPADGPRLSALTADYQSRIHFFESGVYHSTVEVPTDGVIPYDYRLRFARDHGGMVLLAVYSDPRAWTGQRASAADPRIAVLAHDDGRFVPRALVSLAKLAGARKAVSQALFVGYDLRNGLLLVARDARGRVLPHASWVHESDEGVGIRLLPLVEAARCPQVDDYLRGEAPEPTMAWTDWR